MGLGGCFAKTQIELTVREKIDFALLFALGRLCEDPDCESMNGSSFEAVTVG